jgi:tripartite ATP-independent transporter DctM subunit
MLSAALAFAAMLLLAFLGVPLGFAMLSVGFCAFAWLRGLDAAMTMASQQIVDVSANYGLSVLPMFILMGVLIYRAELAEDLYDMANAWLGHFRGGLAQATVLASGVFASISGSSIASAATMSKVAMPSMTRLGYKPGLAAGCVAAAGTLGVLIPPSVPLIIYGIIAEVDIGKLFIAGIGPGVILALLFMATITTITTIRPELGPRGSRSTLHQKLSSLARVWVVMLLFGLVVGGLYFGLFTATEAAGMGAFGALVFCMIRRKLSFSTLILSLVEAAQTTAMIFTIVFGAVVFANFINLSGMIGELVRFIDALHLGKYGVLFVITLVYLILGCLIDTLGMIVLTVPVFIKIVEPLGVNPIWFGVYVTVMAEIGMLTPPVGMNVFTVKALNPGIPLGAIFRGVAPFLIPNILLVVIMIAFPEVSLALVNLMGGR